VTALRLLHNLFEDVADGEVGPQESHSLPVHGPQEAFAGPIHAGDVFQVDGNGAPGVRGARHIPTVFEFGGTLASQTACDLEDYLAAGFLNFDFHHRSGTGYKKGTYQANALLR
jgi:hypothetical protein